MEINKEKPTISSLSEILTEHLDGKNSQQLNTLEHTIKSALLERPRFSISLRLFIFFLIIFLIGTAMSITTSIILSRTEWSMQLLEITELCTEEFQQARRYEKNYFLYKSELDKVLQHLDEADTLLKRASKEIVPVVGAKEIQRLHSHLTQYRRLIDMLIKENKNSAFYKTKKFNEIAKALRNYGSKMLLLALDITKKEREQIFSSIALSKKIPILTFIMFLLLMFYVVVHISRHVTKRLDVLMETTQRIASGDFSPIFPKRKYKDEFSNLAIALNHMMSELEKRQNILVESHKIRAIGNLTAGVAHELNNPLNNIMLTSEMLKEDYDKLSDEKRLEMINDVTSSVERARSIVKNLLDFARESEAKVEHLHIHKIIDETIKLAGSQIKISMIKLHLDIPDNLSPIFGDRNLLGQVFLNLIINAIDTMPRGGHLFIRAAELEDTRFVSIHITDTGAGIPDHLLQSIFDPFFTTKPTGKGTGLGLAVSKGIISKHGGSIEVMSKVGVGTTFSVHLPCVSTPVEFEKGK